MKLSPLMARSGVWTTVTAVLVTAAAFLTALAPVQAQTLRWSSSGDPLTMDPHSQNELMTNIMNAQVYERLLSRDRQLNLTPALATSWQQVSPTLWRFKLRTGVKFHDGTPFNADDVVFSIKRAQAPTSQLNAYALACGEPVKIDDFTLEFRLKNVNPIFLQHIETLPIMSKAWSEKHKVTRPLDFKNREESHESMNANGTGPYMLTVRQPGVRTVHKRNPNWWGSFEGNVQESVFTPIANDATRLAALVSGELDFVHDPAPRDIARLRNTSGVKVIDGQENRIVFIGLDQARDELLFSSVKGKNPFKDKRVREAFYKAIDIQTIARVVMRGESRPTGSMVAPGIAGFSEDVDKRPAFNPDEAKKLLADAGYPNGFAVTLDCPNDRYTNDEAICQAVVPMLSRVGIQIKLNAQTRSLHFDKIGLKENRNTSFYMLGWTPGTFDAHNMLVNIVTMDGPGAGQNNSGVYRNAKVEELTLKAGTEMDPKKRLEMLVEAQKIHKDEYGHIPLHQQTLAWGVRDEVIHDSVKPRPSNDVDLRQVKVK